MKGRVPVQCTLGSCTALNIHELFVQKIDLNIHQKYSINQGSLNVQLLHQLQFLCQLLVLIPFPLVQA